MFQSSIQTVSRKVQPSKLIKTFSLTVLLFSSAFGYAQKLEGTIRYLKTENVEKKMMVMDYLSSLRLDGYTYKYTRVDGNGNASTTYSILSFNATRTRYEDSEENYADYNYRKTDFTIIRDFSLHTIHDIIEFSGKTYIIEDSLQAPNWKILNEMKEIAGHICMNASYIDTIKKQKIVGWYALDIPISGGPERFFGLPGLLLEVDVNDGAMVITADKIEPKKLTTELDFPKKAKGKKISEKGYIALLKKKIDENREQEKPLFDGLRY